jgi:hypothetical protein
MPVYCGDSSSSSSSSGSRGGSASAALPTPRSGRGGAQGADGVRYCPRYAQHNTEQHTTAVLLRSVVVLRVVVLVVETRLRANQDKCNALSVLLFDTTGATAANCRYSIRDDPLHVGALVSGRPVLLHLVRRYGYVVAAFFVSVSLLWFYQWGWLVAVFIVHRPSFRLVNLVWLRGASWVIGWALTRAAKQ